MADKASDVPVCPDGVGVAGSRLWSAVVEEFDLGQHELAVLREACRTVGSIDALQRRVDRDGVMSESSQGVRVHPGLVELRQQRLALAKLLAALRIPVDDVGPAGGVGKRYGVRGVVS